MVITDKKNYSTIILWVIFLVLLISYSIYLFIKSPGLALHLRPHTDQIIPYVIFKMILGLFFLSAVLGFKKIQGNKIWLPAIILTGIICRLILIPSTPVLEDDYNRYLWDGAVSANLYNPYKYSPLDVVDNTQGIPAELHNLSGEADDLMKKINHPHIRTIYPILSQVVFAASYIISPWQYWSWKFLLFLFDLALLLVLLRILKYLSLPLILIAIYWLNPVVIHEFFNAGHMDLLALLFVAISLYLLLKNNLLLSVVFLALAVGFKLWPVVLLPLLLRKLWPDKKAIAINLSVFVLIVLVLFIPVLSSNIDESLGFVKYASKWVNNAAFYTIFQMIIKQIIQLFPFNFVCLPCINRVGIILIFVIISFFILKKQSENYLGLLYKALLIVAVLYLISPTQFPWYYTWIVPLLVIRPKISLLLYPLFLPLYQIKYLSEYIVYIEHVPILLLFILETKGLIWKDYHFYNAKIIPK